jgi:hypothetical protein
LHRDGAAMQLPKPAPLRMGFQAKLRYQGLCGDPSSAGAWIGHNVPATLLSWRGPPAS